MSVLLWRGGSLCVCRGVVVGVRESWWYRVVAGRG